MKKQINIKGMSCRNCVRHVEEVLNEIPGVGNILVNLQKNNAEVEVNDTVTEIRLKEAIEEAGYEVTEIMNLT